MKAKAEKVAEFRNRLVVQQASWAIETPQDGWLVDLPAKKRITLELTPEQQAILKRSTRRSIPSVTLVLYSDTLNAKGHVLACLNMSAARKAAKPQKKGGRS